MEKVKGLIRTILKNRCRKEYHRLWQQKTTSYDSWIQKQEENEESAFLGQQTGEEEKIVFFSYEELKKGESLWQGRTEEIICFVENPRWVREHTAHKLLHCFQEKEQVQVVYGDEDEWSNGGHSRMNPWFKPDYSPDTLLSWFYFGSLTAFRRESLQNVSLEGYTTARQRWYALSLQVCLPLKPCQILHLKEMLVTRPRITYWGFEEEYQSLREKLKSLLPTVPVQGVSIIIPSKDNAKVLARCIKSVVEFHDDLDYEIIVVDNGSGEKTVGRIEELKKEYGFRYLYRPMEFNFSRMCNLGAGESKKDVLLFLNDDCQAIESGWLKKMVDKAGCRHIGAVGAKLYYPHTTMLQHCGVYSIYLGPVHKLQFKKDEQIYSDRRNRDARNVLAVTAACLMVRKEVFEKAGGFDEGLRVAFNDVDFCWRLYELGYQNLIHNEVHLWHHESLSRGSDDSPEKMQRLKSEQEGLYRRHKELWNRDPYYHENFASHILDFNFTAAYEYDHSPAAILTPKRMKALPKKLREDDCVAPMLEFAREAQDWFFNEEEKAGRENQLYFQGNVMVLGSDNACFEAAILFLGEKEAYQVKPKRHYRPELALNVPDQVNVDLCGFACLVETGGLPKGVYEIAFLMKDKCSRQYLMKKIQLKFYLPKTEAGKEGLINE